MPHLLFSKLVWLFSLCNCIWILENKGKFMIFIVFRHLYVHLWKSHLPLKLTKLHMRGRAIVAFGSVVHHLQVLLAPRWGASLRIAREFRALQKYQKCHLSSNYNSTLLHVTITVIARSNLNKHISQHMLTLTLTLNLCLWHKWHVLWAIFFFYHRYAINLNFVSMYHNMSDQKQWKLSFTIAHSEPILWAYGQQQHETN